MNIKDKLKNLLSTHRLNTGELTDVELRGIITGLHGFGLYIRYDSYTSFFDPEYHYMMYDTVKGDLKRVSAKARFPEVSYIGLIRTIAGLEMNEQNIALDVYCNYAPNFDIYGVSKHEEPLYFKLHKSDRSSYWKVSEEFSTEGMKFIDTAFVYV